MDRIELRQGAVCCQVSPYFGAILDLTLEHPGLEPPFDGPISLLRPAATLPHSALDVACYPLVPFVNRIANGHFTFDGRSVWMDPNLPGCRHPIHGHGWQSIWQIETRSPSSLSMAFVHHAASHWPWDYSVRQTFSVTADGLTVTLSLRNEGDVVCPAGLGLHPFFPRPPGTILTASVQDVWLTDADVLPVERLAVPPEWHFATGLCLDPVALDHNFTGWRGEVRLQWPGHPLTLRLSADALFSHLILYTPREADFVCIEPATHMVDAVHHPGEIDHGLCSLPPGASLTGRVQISAGPSVGAENERR